MDKFRVTYENLNGQTKVTFVNEKTPEDAENLILNNNPEVLQVINVTRVF